MNSITVEYEDKLLRFMNPQSFQVSIDDIQVSIEYRVTAINCEAIPSLTIRTIGEADLGQHDALLLDIGKLIFLLMGSYPKLKRVLRNEKEIELENLSGKYKTSDEFMQEKNILGTLNPKTLNESIINSLRCFRPLPIESLQCLVSEIYEPIMQEHKLTLLLHVIDGICKKESYTAAVQHILDRTLFLIEERYNCEICSILDVSPKEYVRQLVDTRHWYSHFLKDSERKKHLSSGKIMRFNFEILLYSIRLYLIGELGITVDEENIKNFYFMIHDWIAYSMGYQDVNFKTAIYQLAQR